MSALPQDIVSCAITAGCSPLAVETAINERGHTDSLLMLARETEVDLMLVHALAERWGITVEARCREHRGSSTEAAPREVHGAEFP